MTYAEHDLQLVNRVVSGDRQAFRSIVDDHQRLVNQIVSRFVGQSADRQDLAQDIFVKVYQSLTRFRGEARLSTWIGQIAYNSCINFVDKRRLPALSHLSAADQLQAESATLDQPLPDELTDHVQLKSAVWSAIDQLPPLHGLVISLYHLQELSYEEIGEILSLPAGTVKSHLFRGRQKLKLILQESLRGDDRCA